MYTIKRAAELTGVSLSTLRAWERRYGVVTPARSDGRYRLYSAEDLRTLAIMAALVNDGWSAKEAAAETKARISDSGRTMPWTPATSETTSRPRLDDLLEAGHRLDSAKVADILDEAFARAGFERVVDDWLMPALVAVGEAWADGRISVAGEHLLSYAVSRRLAAAYEAAGSRPTRPVVVVGLPTGARHELGILAFAVAARRAGFATTYVGADLPADDWDAAVSARRAAAVVLAVPRAADIVAARQLSERLLAAHPQLLVFVGGAMQDEVGAETVPLGHGIGAAVELMESTLASRRPDGGPTGERDGRPQDADESGRPQHQA
ncbi:MerR family transcriptional regulator [Intrasporangium sp.]|uniref:MerR family transcriptional regulator n=1 Tax=Intrasporangium sp. TaxID=1925024 RepID=UPI002939BD9E|nr:MerR family transcriptional regulator [Intrasporangium sp.]MDV3222215.1 MerR family transcriptional regulator [Intrasporangium sp.]